MVLSVLPCELFIGVSVHSDIVGHEGELLLLQLFKSEIEFSVGGWLPGPVAFRVLCYELVLDGCGWEIKGCLPVVVLCPFHWDGLLDVPVPKLCHTTADKQFVTVLKVFVLSKCPGCIVVLHSFMK